MSLFKKLLMTMVVVGVAGAVVGAGTFASFSATTTNPGNTFSAGTLTMTNSQDATHCTGVTSYANCSTLTLTTATNMKPSGTASGTATITNAGSLPATYTMSFATVTTTGLGAVLNVTIYDNTTSTCLYGVVGGLAVGSTPTKGNGPCTSISAATSTIANNAFSSLPGSGSAVTIPGSSATQWAGGGSEAHALTVTIEFPDTGLNQNTLQGLSASFDVTFLATQ